MKKLCYTLLPTAALSGCGNPSYTIWGQFTLTPGDSLFVKDIYHNDSILTTGVVASDSSFSLKGTLSEPTIVRIYNQHEQLVYPDIFLERGDIRIVPREDIGGYNATGTPLNDSLNSFNARYITMREKYQTMIMARKNPEIIPSLLAPIIKRAVDNNADNLTGLFIFHAHEFSEISRDSAGVAAARSRLDQFTPTLTAHPLMQKMLRELEIIENTSIGKPYTELTLPNPAGTPISLSSLVGPGRWVLIEFWATWCGPCMSEVPYLVDAYTAFGDKGFEIYGISLDNDTQKWQQVIAEKQQDWTHVLGIDSRKKSPAARSYGIRSIPANLLISPEGIIVAKDLRGEALQAKLREVID